MKKKEKEELLSKATKRFTEAYSAEQPNRDDSMMCSDFSDGRQWDAAEKSKREKDAKPIITVNKLRKFVMHTGGDIQQNLHEVKISPKGNESTEEMARLYEWIIKDIEDNSAAQIAYDWGVQQAAEGGYGTWRLYTEYRENSFEQDIKIARVPNRFSVVLDPFAQDACYADAEYGFILEQIPKDKFNELWPQHKNISGSWENPNGVFQWYTIDSITIAEYFWKKPKHEEVWELDNGAVLWGEQIDLLKTTDEYAEIEATVLRKRTQLKYDIYWAKIVPDAILEGPIKVPGIYIPIVRFPAYEFNDRGYRRFRAIIYDSLDSSRMYNYWKVNTAQILGGAGKPKYFVTDEQIAGHKSEWDEMVTSTSPYIRYNPLPNQPSPWREEPLALPLGAASEAQSAALDIQDTIGMYGASLGQPSKERTGRALRLQQARSATTVFPLVRNYYNARLHTARILLRMIPEVYSGTRIMRRLAPDGNFNQVKLNNPILDWEQENVAQRIDNDLKVGFYDVVPTMGTYYVTERDEAVASMLDFIQFFPMAAPLLMPKIARYMKWEGADELAGQLEALLQQQMMQQSNVANKKSENALSVEGNF